MTKTVKTSLFTIVFISTIFSSIAFANNTFNQVCSACHATGAAGAPIVGNASAWAARIAKGKAALYNSAINGFGGMPAKGGHTSISDAEIKATVDFMVSKSKK